MSNKGFQVVWTVRPLPAVREAFAAGHMGFTVSCHAQEQDQGLHIQGVLPREAYIHDYIRYSTNFCSFAALHVRCDVI